MANEMSDNYAELFSRWLLNWLNLDAETYGACLLDLSASTQNHFNEAWYITTLERYYSEHDVDETNRPSDIQIVIRTFLKFCIYKSEDIPVGDGLSEEQDKKKAEIDHKVESLQLKRIKSVLLEVIMKLCKDFDGNVKEGPEMADILDDFEFDKSCLPTKFDADAYIDAVGKSVGKIVKGDPVYMPAVIGLLLTDGHNDHNKYDFHNLVQASIKELNSQVTYLDYDQLPNEVYITYNAIDIFSEAYDILKNDATVTKPIFYRDYASVCKSVIKNINKRYPKQPKFDKYIVKEYVDKSFTCSSGGSAHGGGNGVVEIDLPPLSGAGSGSDEIVPDNIKAVATIYMSYQLDMLQLIPAADRVVELSMAGLLPYTYDNTMRIIDEYAWSQTERLNDVARYSQYSRALGVSGGQVTQDVIPNNEFSGRLRHAVSSIANFALSYDTQKPLNDRSEYVRKSVRDLAANASYYGWAGTFFVAERLKKHIDDAVSILSLPQIQDAYGVTNMWQVIERVAQREFGMTVNVVKHRTLALEAKTIFELIADKADIWSNPTGRTLFSLPAVGGNAAVIGDLDQNETSIIFRAAQYILAVEGYGDTQVDQYSQPIATTATPSLPSLGAFAGGGTTPSVDSSKLQQFREGMLHGGQPPDIGQLLS